MTLWYMPQHAALTAASPSGAGWSRTYFNMAFSAKSALQKDVTFATKCGAWLSSMPGFAKIQMAKCIRRLTSFALFHYNVSNNIL